LIDRQVLNILGPSGVLIHVFWRSRRQLSSLVVDPIPSLSAPDADHSSPAVDAGQTGKPLQPPTDRQPLQVLLLACVDGRSAQTITDHIDALARYSRHRVLAYNHFPAISSHQRDLPAKLDLARFDVVVIHYSMYLLDERIDYLDRNAKDRIRAFAGAKIVFRQDEYNHVDGLITVLRQIGADALFTNFPAEEARKVYRDDALPGLRLESNLTGYVPDSLLEHAVLPLAERAIDVGYRSRALPFWLGSLGTEKARIATEFGRHARRYGLSTDISVKEDDRIYGAQWPRFIAGCRAVLGTESGASVIDFSGEIRRRCEQYVRKHPDSSFEEVQALFFRDLEWRYHLEQISPRCFEAACLRTAMVLFEGNYSGILKPWRHYIPLRKDFANVAEVVAALRDLPSLQQMVDRTYAEIALDPQYSFRSFVERFDRVLEEEVARKVTPRVTEPYSADGFERAAYEPEIRRNAGIDPISPISIHSSLLTEPGHPLERATTNDGGTALARQNQPLPHEFEVVLPGTFAVHTLRLLWGSVESCPSVFHVDFIFRGSTIHSISVTGNSAADCTLSADLVRCMRLRVRIERYHGEQRLCLRHVEIYGVWQPLGGLRARPVLETFWRAMPASARGRVRQYLGGIVRIMERLH
jgi:hypothetical protein